MKNKLYILILITFFSCKEKDNVVGFSTLENNLNDTISTIETDTSTTVEIQPIDENKLNQYCDSLDITQKELINTINKNSAIDNTLLYLKYKKNRKKAEEKLSNLAASLIDNYINYYDESSQQFKLPKDLKKIENKLISVDIECWYIGEGYTELRTLPSHYYSLFKGKVTPDFEEFIKQKAKEDATLYSSDGGIVVPFIEVGNRVAFWEKFINEHPNSVLLPNANEFYTNYLNDFIFGQDNTPTFEDNIIYPEILTVYESFSKMYPNSKTTQKINALKKLLESGVNDFNDFNKLNIKGRSFTYD